MMVGTLLFEWKKSGIFTNLLINPISTLVMPLVIFFLALIPRVIDLGTGLTTDETLWLVRAPSFIDAVMHGNFAGTYITLHPGVTTMWISGLFIKIFSYPGQDFSQFLSIARLPVAFVTSFGIILMYFLLKKLLNEKIAFLASVLIALDPYLIANSRFIHLDAIVTTFMILAILSFLLYIYKPDRSAWLILTGVFLGLALLSKQPALILIPYFILVLIGWRLFSLQRSTNSLRKTIMEFWSAASVNKVFKPFFIILCIAGLVFVVIWPAMWVAPLTTISKLATGLEYVVENPHGNYGFFFGQITTTDKFGPFYYFIVILMKTTPIVLIFSLFCIVYLFFNSRSKKIIRINFTIVFFVLYILLFYTLMTIGKKELNRYILPVFPIIDILAAIGVYFFFTFILDGYSKFSKKSSDNHSKKTANHIWGLVMIIIVILQSILIIPIAPYFLSYSNPLVLDGPAHSPDIILVGWGEGLDLAAAYLNNKPNASNLTVGVQYNGFKEYFKGTSIVSMREELDSASPDYFVFYICTVQRHYNYELWEEYKNDTPEKVITLNNIEYCWIYRAHTNKTASNI